MPVHCHDFAGVLLNHSTVSAVQTLVVLFRCFAADSVACPSNK